MCREVKPITAFRNRGGSQKHLVKSRCNSCLYKEHLKWTEENKEKVREYRNRDKWTIVKRCSRRGISPEQLVDAYEKQNEMCPICETKIELLNSAIDHNHETNEFRGVLCKQCNRALGMFKDNKKILLNAVRYLEINGTYGK